MTKQHDTSKLVGGVCKLKGREAGNLEKKARRMETDAL